MNGETFSSTDVIGQKSKQKSNKEILDGISDTTRNALSKYVECIIGYKELCALIASFDGVNLSQNRVYKVFISSLGLKRVVNNVDKLIDECDWPPSSYSTLVGYYIYKNGDVMDILYSDIKDKLSFNY